jgi:hypothetical protein
MRRPDRRFLHKLAIHVYGVGHPDFIPHEITADQFVEMLAYYQIEPWGPDRDSFHAAQIAFTLNQLHTKRRLHLKDYILKFGPQYREKPKKLSEKLREVAYRIRAKIVERKK